MPVSNQRQKMALAAADNLDNTYGEIVQAIVNAAWHEFDADGKNQPEINKDYFIRCEYHDEVVRPKMARFDDEGWWRGNGVGLVKRITHYADPDDLLYVQKQKGQDDV